MLIIGALINMEIKVVYMIHDATVERYVLASRKNIDVSWEIRVVVIMTTYYSGGTLWLPRGVL